MHINRQFLFRLAYFRVITECISQLLVNRKREHLDFSNGILLKDDWSMKDFMDSICKRAEELEVKNTEVLSLNDGC